MDGYELGPEVVSNAILRVSELIAGWNLKTPTPHEITTVQTELESCAEKVSALVEEKKSLQKQIQDLRYKLECEVRKTGKLEKQMSQLREKQMENERTINEMKSELNDLKEEALENKMLFKLYDLCFMFNHYRTLPIVKNLGKVNPNYSSLDSDNKLSSAFSELESNFEDGLISEEDFKNFLLPINTALGGIDFSEIIHISNERHGIAHSDTRSANKQKQFLRECKTYNFLRYQTLANAMISQLDLVALKLSSVNICANLK